MARQRRFSQDHTTAARASANRMAHTPLHAFYSKDVGWRCVGGTPVQRQRLTRRPARRWRRRSCPGLHCPARRRSRRRQAALSCHPRRRRRRFQLPGWPARPLSAPAPPAARPASGRQAVRPAAGWVSRAVVLSQPAAWRLAGGQTHGRAISGSGGTGVGPVVALEDRTEKPLAVPHDARVSEQADVFVWGGSGGGESGCQTKTKQAQKKKWALGGDLHHRT